MDFRKQVVRFAGAAAILGVAAGCGSRTPPDAFEAGLRALERGRHALAASALERAAIETPDEPAVHTHLGIAYRELDRLPQAEQAFRRAAALTVDDPRPLEFLADIHVRQQQWNLAREALDGAAQRAPNSARVLTAMALVQLHTAGPDAAKALLLRALTLEPRYPPALYDLALLYRDSYQDKGSAVRSLQMYLDADPKGGRVAEARQAVKDLTAPPKPAPRPASAPPPAAATPRPGCSCAAVTNAAAAASGSSARADEALALARKTLEKGKVQEALSRLKKAIDRYPQNADLRWELARMTDQPLGKKDDAAALMQEFARCFPDDPRAAEARRYAGGPAAGTPPAAPAASTGAVVSTQNLRLQFKKPAQRNAGAALDAFNRAARYQKASDWRRAAETYKKAIECDDTFLNAYFNLGLVYVAMGDHATARDAFTYALKLQPEMARTRYMLAVSSWALREQDRAVADLREAIRIDPDYAEAHLLMGLIYQDDPQEVDLARRHFSRYVELAPTGHAAAQAKNWLRYHETH